MKTRPTRKKPSVLSLGAAPLTIEQVQKVARGGQKVALAPEARKRVQVAHEYLLEEVNSGQTLYGVNTGFGVLSNVRIDRKNLERLQINLLRSHAIGVGEPLGDVEVRAMLLLRAAALAHGHSGVKPELIDALLALLNRGVIPVIPSQGSVGASGDLAPLAHLALVLIGEGRARYKGKEISGSQALKLAKLKPIRLGPKEGLALINGTQFMLALGALALMDAENLVEWADATGAMTLEALRGTLKAFDSKVQAVRPHPGQATTAQRFRALLTHPKTGKPSAIAKSHAECSRVQDPYSLRCIPQVHGAVRDVLGFVRGVLERELNSVTDNPLVFPREREIISGGNFHGEPVAMALDFLAIAVSELASISEQRLAKLVNPALSDLPAFLVKDGGINSGFMIVQVAAAALVSENKGLCHPASVDSIPTSADKEDHVSMGPWAARKAIRVIENSTRVLALELLGAAQGVDLLRPLKSTNAMESIHQFVRKRSARYEQDRSLHADLEKLYEAIRTSAVSEVIS